MFERRVEKSSKWVTENEDSFQNFSSVEEDYHERTISDGLHTNSSSLLSSFYLLFLVFARLTGPPNLRLLLDPRHVEVRALLINNYGLDIKCSSVNDAIFLFPFLLPPSTGHQYCAGRQ